MTDPISIRDIDLTPVAGRTYFSIDREWHEEVLFRCRRRLRALDAFGSISIHIRS